MATHQEPSNNNIKKKLNLRIVSIIAALLIVNIIVFNFHSQLDLTKDKRYTITPSTTKMLKHLDKDVFVTVFLTGNNLPAPYKKLSNSINDLLSNFRDISHNKVDFRFVDPLGNDSNALKALVDFKMSGFPVTIANGKKGMKQEMIFPWALVVMDGKPWPMMLQESNSPRLTPSVLEKSNELLEYNIATAIHQLAKNNKDTIAFITGNDEASKEEIISSLYYLLRFYTVDTFNLNTASAIPAKYKAVIINRPTQAFSEAAKFKIDQYLMHGGNIYLGINKNTGALDSLRNANGTFNALPINLNLSDLLFQYGVRINSNLIKDADDCIQLPIPSSENDDNPMTYPWQYYPILHPPKGTTSPIVKNLNEVLGKFVSSIDTLQGNENIKKTVLLTTSKYTTTEAIPTPIILATIANPINRSLYNSPHQIAAVLLEGKFNSLYKNHLPDDVKHLIDSNNIQPLYNSPKSGKIIIASDADLILNETSSDGSPMDMGMVPFSMYRFENKAFLLNSMEYLTDPENLLEARTKSYTPQLLDATRVQEERSQWQWINIGVPVLLVLLFGAVYLFIRKKRYT